MNIGNWKITDSGIEWSGDSMNRLSIEAATLCETAELGDGLPVMYKWILLATDEEWLSHDDLYDFNNAFLYAAGSLRQPLDYEVFDRTLTYQFELLDEEVDTEPGLDLSAPGAAEEAKAEQQRKDAFSERD